MTSGSLHETMNDQSWKDLSYHHLKIFFNNWEQL